jgi:hypothetical protein
MKRNHSLIKFAWDNFPVSEEVTPKPAWLATWADVQVCGSGQGPCVPAEVLDALEVAWSVINSPEA